ncbi:MAG: 3-deoxy-manno-octulosonate cytidylyltransferase [Elusimicrobia bacterium]|nr:3-deoxy-manno-octulosonate cytidylyltransferase [Elusimicrobiota bacterium]
MNVKVAAIIPARMASSRFPGKPLLPFQGLPMVEHVRRRVLLSGVFSDVVVAACDQEIKRAIESYGGRVMMTSPDHPGATDRVCEAARQLDATHVVNVQGDEILILPEDLKKMVDAIHENPAGPAWNAVAPIAEASELDDRAVVKCVVTQTNRVMFCSRIFSHLKSENVRIILGLLGYEKKFLLSYGKLSRTPLEIQESIDQNRILEHNIPLQGVEFLKGYPGINEPREVAMVEKYMQEDPRQIAVLEKILMTGVF